MIFQQKIDIHLEPATTAELLREDEVLMEMTGFLQGILFIYLGIFQIRNDSSLFTFFMFGIPITGILFYVVRAFARIRNSNRLRVISFYLLFIMFVCDFSLFIPVLNLPLNVLVLAGLLEVYGISVLMFLGVFLVSILATRYERR